MEKRKILSELYFFREIISLATSLLKTLLSRNFCHKSVRVNFQNFHTVHTVIYLFRFDLFKKELGPALKSMKLECEDWTANSFRVNVFAKILNRSGTASGFYPDLIISIFHDVLNKEVEPELQLKMFLTLSKLLYDVKNTLDSQNEFKQFVLKLVLELIFPALKWKSGRKCEAVRIAATSSLWSVFNSGSLEPKDLWNTNLATKLIPSMNRLLEDDAVRIRVFVCQVIFVKLEFFFVKSLTTFLETKS